MDSPTLRSPTLPLFTLTWKQIKTSLCINTTLSNCCSAHSTRSSKRRDSVRLLSSPLNKILRSLAEEHIASAPSLLKAATEDKVSREGDHFAQVLIAKLVGNLVWVDTRCETEKPKVIPMMGECPLSTMMLVGAAKRPCILWLNHPFFANGFLNLESCNKSLIQTTEMFFFGVRIGP